MLLLLKDRRKEQMGKNMQPMVRHPLAPLVPVHGNGRATPSPKKLEKLELVPLEKNNKNIPSQIGEPNFSESFSQGKNSREEDSKITFNELDVAMNVSFENENIIPRKGTTTFVTDTNILDIGIFKGINGNELISVYKNLTNSKIKKIDRTTGVMSDYNTINYIATTEVFTQGATGKLTRASATDLTTILTIGDTIRIDIAVSQTGYKEIIAVVEYVEATYFTLIGYPSFYAGGVTKVLYTSNTTTISLNGTDIDFASGAGAMYFSDNTSGIQVITSGVSYVPYITAPGNAHRLTYCSGRLWAAGDDGVLYYSKKISSGSVQSFDITAENDTGGATTTNVGEVIALGSYGSRVIVFGRNSIEVHTAPAFTGGEITFGEAPNTLIQTFDGYGIDYKKAFCITGSVVYFVNNGGFYQYLLGDTPPRNINKNRGEHKTLSFNQAAMYFDEDNQTIYIACTKQGSANDYGISYKIVEHGNLENNAFSNFDNIDVKSFAGDSEDIYYLQSYAGVIKRIEGTSDDGLAINCSIMSANINNGDVRYIKIAKKLYLNAESDGGDVINYAFYKNTKDNTNAAPSFNYTATIPAYSGFSVGVEGAFGLTPWGLSAYSTVNNENREMMWFSKNIGSQYLRGKVGLTFSTLNKLQIRGLGWYFTRTVKRSQDIEFG